MPSARWPTVRIEDMAIDMFENGHSSATVHTRISRLKRTLAIMQPTADLKHFGALLREIELPTEKFDAVVWRVTSADLQNFGIWVMDHASTIAIEMKMPVGAIYCCGLQVALIAARPWRKRTFTAIELGSNMVRVGGNWRMRAHADENKQRRYQSGLVPKRLGPYMDTFVDEYRPQLCRLSGYMGNAMWINKKGQPMTTQQFYFLFTRLTAAKFTERLTVHAARKIAATTMALHNPREVNSVPGILGHSRPQSSAAYNLAGAVQAHAALDATFDGLVRAAGERRRLRTCRPQ